MRKLMMLSVSLGLLLASANAAVAVPITWHLNDLLFDDGGTATGSFVYDADANTFADINVTTTAGTVRAGDHYGVPTGMGGSRLVDMIGMFPVIPGSTPRFLFSLATAMTNAGGTIAVQHTDFHEATCATVDCTQGVAGTFREVTSGTITSVPEPASLLLLAAGIAGLTLKVGRRRA